MAAEAEAAREARAKVIAAEGEFKASTALKEASMVIAQSPAALQLRYLQVQSFTIELNYYYDLFSKHWYYESTTSEHVKVLIRVLSLRDLVI